MLLFSVLFRGQNGHLIGIVRAQFDSFRFGILILIIWACFGRTIRTRKPFKLSQSVNFILISINFVSKSFNLTFSNNNFSNKINIFSGFTKFEIFLRCNCFVEEFWNTAFLKRFYISSVNLVPSAP